MLIRVFAGSLVLLASALNTHAQVTAPPLLQRQIDSISNQVLQATGVPSATVAVVRNGSTYANAYGAARLDPRVAASPNMRYAVGSISKQFTAVSALLLQQDGKLKLDDPISKYVPGLTRGNDVIWRQILRRSKV